jgi:glycosyltransferase involved in cell wall biosynthesis
VARRAEAERGAARAYFRWEAEKIVRFQRRVAGRVALHVAVSALDAERLSAFDPRAKTTVVDNGVDVEYFRPGASGRPEEGGLVFMGLLNCFPNRDAVSYFLTDVWPALVADDPRRRITIVGREPPPELFALAAGDTRVSILGNVPDVRPHLDAASIFVCPLRVGGGTRLKVLDALATGKALVATTLSVEGLDLADGEHYLRADTPAEFVAQIRRLEADAAVRRRLAQAGRQRVIERYGWERIGEKLGRAYELVATERTGRGEATTPGRLLRSPAASAIRTYNRSR